VGRTNRAWCADLGAEGALLVLDAEQSHHVAQVLRLRAGDPLELFDGKGRARDASVVVADRSGTSVRAGAERSELVEAAYRVTLYQALTRPERLEWVLQKGTEVGVHAFGLVRTRRVEGADPTPDRLERLRRIAREASRQSGRTIVPEVFPPEPLPRQAREGLDALVLDPGPGSEPLAELLRCPSRGAADVLIGPEGGLDDEELALLQAGGWRRASLGPRTLRTETAGVVAAALLLHVRGDLGRRPGGEVDAPPPGS